MKRTGWAALGIVTCLCLPLAAGGSEHGAVAPAVPAAEALQRLEQGEERFVTGHPVAKDVVRDRAALVGGQHPYAIVLTCSDSRVAPEVVFDTSIGELFVVRVARKLGFDFHGRPQRRRQRREDRDGNHHHDECHASGILPGAQGHC